MLSFSLTDPPPAAHASPKGTPSKADEAIHTCGLATSANNTDEANAISIHVIADDSSNNNKAVAKASVDTAAIAAQHV